MQHNFKVFKWIIQNTTRWGYQVIEVYLWVWFFLFCGLVRLCDYISVPLLCLFPFALVSFCLLNAHFYSLILCISLLGGYTLEFKCGTVKSMMSEPRLSSSPATNQILDFFSLWLYFLHLKALDFPFVEQNNLQSSFLQFYTLIILYICLFTPSSN